MPIGTRMKPTRVLFSALSFAIVLASAGTSMAAEEGDDYYAGDPRLSPVVEHLRNERYKEAIDLLNPLEQEEPDDPDVQNLLGFSYRKLTFFDVAKKHYARALDIDPEHKGAHEYLGELYLKTDQLDLAKAQLERLGELCGFFCNEKRRLKKAIRKYEKAN